MVSTGGWSGRRPVVRVLVAWAAAGSCLLLGGPASALRQPEKPRGPVVRAYAQWNADYLCLAARVPDVMLTGTSTTPMSAPRQDDAVEFCFEVRQPRGVSAYRFAVSAAGGMSVLMRDARGQWRADPSWIAGPQTVKYAVKVNGSLNDPSDEDAGFDVECAIPWRFLAEAPPVGGKIGFNVVVWVRGESEGVASWAATVRSSEHVGEAARWGSMTLESGAAMRKALGASAPCPYVGQTPFIDGALGAPEWLTATTLEFEKPTPTLRPGAPPVERSGAAAAVLATYRYDWEGDAGERDGALLWREDGLPATAHQPRLGAGPWVSWRRVDWHAEQLEEAQRAGVDILLLGYSAEERARRSWARAGLLRFVQALKERRAKGLGYPLVGMMLDTDPLAGVDLRDRAGKRLLYGMIREFFLHVPPEFRAQMAARPEAGLPGAVPIMLGPPDGLAGWDASFTAYCEEHFAQDFEGARLVWIGGAAWRRQEDMGFHAYLDLPKRSGFSLAAPGSAAVAAVSPGRCPPPGQRGEVQPRQEGRSYRSDWQRVLAAQPELVIIESWNDYEWGTEVAPSRQYGVVYVDLTRLFEARLGTREPHRVWLKQARLPEVVPAGAACEAEFVVENAGIENLRTGPYLSAAARIARCSDGKVVRRDAAVQSLAVPAGGTRRIPVVITAKDDEGEPLSPGQYLYTLSVVRSKVAYLRSRWFASTVAELTVPFQVADAPRRKAGVVSTSLPATMESGGSEEVVVRLRNEGSEPWLPGEVRLGCRWVRWSDELSLPSAAAWEEIGTGAGWAEVPHEVQPGETVSLMVRVRATDGDGQPLPPSGPEELWHYRLVWDMVEGERGGVSGGRGAGSEAVEVVRGDPGAVIVSAAPAGEMKAGQTARATLTIANAGRHTWAAPESEALAQWHRWDGRPLDTEASETPLPADVAPGEQVTVEALLRAPDRGGPYRVLWGVVCNAQSGSPAGRRRDQVVSDVFVTDDNLRSCDLSSFANNPGIAREQARARGDFDGSGRALPAEWLPPDQSAARESLYPTGYYSPADEKAGVPFAFPDTSSGVGGVVACDGQRIPLGERPATRVHLLVGSTAGTGRAAFGLALAQGGMETVEAVIPSWREPAAGAHVGAYAPYVRSVDGDETGDAYLYHVTLAATSGQAEALILPGAPWIKVVAVTAEAEASE